MKKISSNRLTIRYSLYQMFFFITSAGIFAFAVTYLLDKGFQTLQAGLILAATNLIFCVIQPVLGDFADCIHRFVLIIANGIFRLISESALVLVRYPIHLLH